MLVNSYEKIEQDGGNVMTKAVVLYNPSFKGLEPDNMKF